MFIKVCGSFGTGVSTLAELVVRALKEKGIPAELVDDDQTVMPFDQRLNAIVNRFIEPIEVRAVRLQKPPIVADDVCSVVEIPSVADVRYVQRVAANVSFNKPCSPVGAFGYVRSTIMDMLDVVFYCSCMLPGREYIYPREMLGNSEVQAITEDEFRRLVILHDTQEWNPPPAGKCKTSAKWDMELRRD